MDAHHNSRRDPSDPAAETRPSIETSGMEENWQSPSDNGPPVELYRSLFQANPASLLLVEPDSGRILDANQAACRHYGLSAGEMRVRTVAELPGLDPNEKPRQLFDVSGRGAAVVCVEKEIEAAGRLDETLPDLGSDLHTAHARLTALAECSAALREQRDFDRSVKRIFHAGKKLIGATSGYVVLLNPDWTENEVLFPDSGGVPYTVDESLAMPIQDLHTEACLTGSPVFENDFPDSRLIKPVSEEQTRLRNVLFAPMVLEGKALGLIVLANKPEKFTAEDARSATQLADFAALAWANSRISEALEHSEARLRSIVQTSNEAIFYADSTGKTVLWNRGAEKIFGYSADEMIGKPLNVIAPNPDDDPDRVSIAEFFASWESIPSDFPLEMICHRKDGTEFPAELFLASWETRDGSFFTGIVRDITQKKQAERRLQESEERFRAIFRSARDCIFLKDADLRYALVNPFMENLLELPEQSIVGRDDEELFGPEAAARTRPVDLRVLEGETVETEHAITVAGRRVFFFDLKVPLSDAEGKIVGICGISRDITDRRHFLDLPFPSEPETRSPEMMTCLSRVRMAAKSDSVVLFTGESGSGKDYLSRYLHNHSERSTGPFFSINCAAVPSDLAESELFGHEQGAFTGAYRSSKGLLELAEGGTLLLNEICELSLPLQAKLLTFLDTWSIMRVGGRKTIKVNARIIAATNRDLAKEVEEGRFRPDLYYRLNVLNIPVPPLRERVEDIPTLVDELVGRLAADLQIPAIPEIDTLAMDKLCRYKWPGNVRELRNVIERALILSGGGPLQVDSLALQDAGLLGEAATFSLQPGQSLNVFIRDLKIGFVTEALRCSGGNKSATARKLGITRYSLARLMKSLGLADGT
ncbi:MAG: sigma 54-interacting transcriptional regulator [Desulfomonile tiedjei]|nr:sigma 54-interacting transcriptional regulator [Desulfomonile tiedjei]